ncbi:MAG: NADH-quinone oxidoreductase subunit NuoG [Pseudomonadales bacterium]|nr:NADH-quinone oxidoreductase subunit NuoG [Pseudomonadales bacterium]
MPKITVDDQEYEVTAGENVLQACLSHGLDLPYFCWHPAMGSVGACRQCAVIQYQDEDDTRGRLIMSCMTPVADGTRYAIAVPQAQDFRASVIEWLMENHPHDCPVCEEGGECHLQDMTVMTGHTSRRYRGQKRTFENQNLGPFINHEMNRCITCYRCVRFYRDYAGGSDLAALGSRDRMYFGRSESGVLESEFSGNLVEVCPTGVFTDKPFSATYNRKWDLQSAPSICTGCALGCNIFTSERYGTLKRIHNRYHAEVNRYFLCDRGRFGMTYTNSKRRIRTAGRATSPGVFEPVQPDIAVQQISELISSGSVIGIGSPRASLEDNFALQRLVGKENFCGGLSDRESACLAESDPAHISPTLAQVEDADAVLILGEDLLNTAPRLALSIRQATRNTSLTMAADAGIPLWRDAGVRGHAQQARNSVMSATMLPTRLDDIVSLSFNGEPKSLARCGFAIANRISLEHPGVSDLTEEEQEFVAACAQMLEAARHPIIITGTSSGEASLISAANNINKALEKNSRLIVVPTEANTTGVRRIPAALGLEDALMKLGGTHDTLLVLQNDLFRRAAPEKVTAALDRTTNVIVIDSLENPTLDCADWILPAATAAESTGTLVNYEARAQRHYQTFVPNDDIRPSWRWLSDMGSRLGRAPSWSHVDEIVIELAEQASFRGLGDVAPSADYRSLAGLRVPRAPHRYSGRTAMYADKSLHEPKSVVDDETPLAYSMEGLNRDQPGALLPYVWSPGWNSNQSIFKFQAEVGGSLRGGDPGVILADYEKLGSSAASLELPVRPGKAQNGEFRLLSLPVLFGGEELTGYVDAIQERGTGPMIVLHPTDGARLDVSDGDGVVCLDYSLLVKLNSAIEPGTAAVSSGLQNAPAWLPDNSVTLRRDENFVRPPEVIARG